jgi:hypothetical protein
MEEALTMSFFKKFGRGGLVCALFLLTGLGAAVATSPAAAGGRFDDRMLAEIKADPENTPADKRFSFIVFGDRTHSGAPVGTLLLEEPATKVFQQILREADLLSPSFVLFAGDLIEGYDKPEIIQREWDEVLPIAGGGKTPFVALPGNHDVQNPATEQIWQKRVGDRYFSFDYGNSHFIGLDSEEEAAQGAAEPKGIISRQQLAWLKADLEAHKNAANIFVALHEPLFLYGESNWDIVHALLKQFPVRAVFAGHYHEYRKLPARDGIEYIVTGGGGGELDGHPELGQFHHYLLVQVDGGRIRWSVIQPGSVLPPDVITEDLLKQFAQADQLIRIAPEIGPEAGKASSATLSVAVRNPDKTAATMNLSWELPNAGWQVTPATAQLKVPAGEERKATITLQAKDPGWFGGPLPQARVEIPILAGQQRLVVRRGIEQMDFLLNLPPAGRPLTIDGDLSDWEGVPPLWVRPPFDTPNWTPADASGLFRVTWDKQWVYLSAEMRDDAQVASPAAIDSSQDNAGFAFKNIPGGPNYYSIILVLINGEGKILHNLREPSGAWVPTPIPGAKVKIIRREGRTIYEAAVPRKDIFPEVPAAGVSFLTQLSWGDVDNDSAPQVIGWTELKTIIK